MILRGVNPFAFHRPMLHFLDLERWFDTSYRPRYEMNESRILNEDE